MTEQNSKKKSFNFIYILLSLSLFLVSLAAFLYSNLSKDITISFTEEQVQEKIDNTPLKQISKFGIKSDINYLAVDFLETNKVLIDVDFTVYGYSVEAIGKGQLKTSVVYRNGDFFIHEPEFRDFNLVVQKQKTKIEKMKYILSSSFNRLKNKFSEEEQSNIRYLANSFVNKYEPQVKSMIQEEVKHILSEKPIYSLNDKDIKQSIAALILQDIKFTDKEAIAVLKPTSIFTSPIFIIIGCFLFILILSFFISRSEN
jgi:hypothetical protein